MQKLLDKLKRYNPYNEQEKADKSEIIKHLLSSENIFSRENKSAHFTASSWIVSKNRDKVLMIHHNIYNSWAWLGGHADDETDLLAVSLKEAKEESGLTKIKALAEDIFSLEILTVDGHEKRGEYVSSHLHLNITFLLEADEEESLFIKHDENSDITWFSLDEGVDASSEIWFRNRIYKKLNEKLLAFRSE